MSFAKAMEIATRDERFMATVYAMNSLLIHKSIYTQEEFEVLFVEWMEKEQRKRMQSDSKPSLRAAYSQA